MLKPVAMFKRVTNQLPDRVPGLSGPDAAHGERVQSREPCASPGEHHVDVGEGTAEGAHARPAGSVRKARKALVLRAVSAPMALSKTRFVMREMPVRRAETMLLTVGCPVHHVDVRCQRLESASGFSSGGCCRSSSMVIMTGYGWPTGYRRVGRCVGLRCG